MGVVVGAILMLFGVGRLLRKGAEWGNWLISGQKKLEDIYQEQKGRLAEEYKVRRQQLEERAVEVTGQQQAALAAMGQAGGEGTAGAGIIGVTQARSKRDLGLLETAYQNALEDLQRQFETSLQEQSTAMGEYMEDAFAEFASLTLSGMSQLSVGMQASTASLTTTQGIFDPAMRIDWGLR